MSDISFQPQTEADFEVLFAHQIAEMRFLNERMQRDREEVEYIMNLRGHGASEEEILHDYPGLTQEDIQACYLFAGKSLGTTSFMPLVPEPV